MNVCHTRARRRRPPVTLLLAVATVVGLGGQGTTHLPLNVFAQTAAPADSEAAPALEALAAGWRDSYASILLELAELSRGSMQSPVPSDDTPPGTAFADPGASPGFGRPDAVVETRAISPVRQRLLRFLERQTGQRFGEDFDRWHQWTWALPYDPHPDYALFKGLLYENVDPRMRQFFPPDVANLIRLDEVEWGGVPVNGIPPLYYSPHTQADAAEYLKDDHIVFGIAINGETRAYPKRILAWHELTWDRIGGVELTIVYCTLCGTVIPYESMAGGEQRRMGTSGLLYRSNKLMFDEGTMSLWSTFEGTPIVGPLVNSGVTLRPRSAVTTTWGEWRRLHPDTTVLSLDTGHVRDYSEGAAYREYFDTDQLMFSVPGRDSRLKNKDEVLIMRIEPAAGGTLVPVAMSAKFLEDRPVFQTEVAGRQLVVVTSREGANRVYDAGASRFSRVGRSYEQVADQDGGTWRITEDGLINDAPGAEARPRVTAQRAFWFGWHAQFPDTILIK